MCVSEILWVTMEETLELVSPLKLNFLSDFQTQVLYSLFSILNSSMMKQIFIVKISGLHDTPEERNHGLQVFEQ